MKIAVITALLMLLLLSACTANAPIAPAETPIPTDTPQTAATIEPTAEEPQTTPTPQPSATLEPERWSQLLPETLEGCISVNKFSPLNLDDLSVLKNELELLSDTESEFASTAYVDEILTIDPKQIKFDFGDNPRESKRPYLVVFNVFNPVFTSCSYLPVTDLEGLFVLGLKVRRPESKQPVIVHIAVDQTGFLDLVTNGGLDTSYYDFRNSYHKIQTQAVFSTMVALVNARGYSAEDGNWRHSLELLYGQEVEGKDPLSALITRYFDSQKKMKEEEINRIQEVLKDVLLPCFALTLHS